MIDLPALRKSLPGMARALAVGVPAGALFSWMGTPVPWMIGPMLAVAAINLCGVGVRPVPFGRQAGQVVLGSAVGLYFTPPVVAALAANLGVIALACASAFAIGGMGAVVLCRVSGVDRKSAFFSSIPGGAMVMAVLAERAGAMVAPVAVAHSLRVSILVIVVPFAITYGGIPVEAVAYHPHVALDVPVLVVWLAAGLAVGALAERLGLQNGYLLAPIFMGAGLTVAGVPLSAVPHWMIDFAQLMFGTILGARYERAFFRRYTLFIPFALVNAVFIIAASAAVGIGLSWAFGLPLATTIIATAPGGMPEMTMTAQALHLGVPVVVAFHLFRIIIVNLGTLNLYALGLLFRRRRPAAPADDQP